MSCSLLACISRWPVYYPLQAVSGPSPNGPVYSMHATNARPASTNSAAASSPPASATSSSSSSSSATAGAASVGALSPLHMGPMSDFSTFLGTSDYHVPSTDDQGPYPLPPSHRLPAATSPPAGTQALVTVQLLVPRLSASSSSPAASLPAAPASSASSTPVRLALVGNVPQVLSWQSAWLQ